MYPHGWRLLFVYLVSAKPTVDMVVTREGKRREKLGGGRGNVEILVAESWLAWIYRCSVW